MTKIEWTDESWNPFLARNIKTGRTGHFCVHKSPGCEFCYAERMQPRFGNPVRYAAQEADKVALFLDKFALRKPLGWRKSRRVFVCSMTDLFYEGHTDEMIDRVFAVMMHADQHQFQVLTKRADRMQSYIENFWERMRSNLTSHQRALGIRPEKYLFRIIEYPLPNVWLGVSAEDQERYDLRSRDLEKIPAPVRWLSLEPLLGPIDMGLMDDYARRSRGRRAFHWVIVGGESGPHARPMDPDWVRSIRDQCVEAGVAFHFKQHGEWIGAQDLRNLPGGSQPGFGIYDNCTFNMEHQVIRVGKKRAGRELDGRTWDEYPA